MEQVLVLEFLKTSIWVESDILGSRHVVVQHENCEAFTYATFHYDHRYTSNAGTFEAAKSCAIELGAADPVEQRFRGLPPSPSSEQIKEQIAALQALLDPPR